jgi:alkanesulfonate monooxygenase SsuD/methylene tetrahydromethanopterin reductase-like flavin-dependent oxidoreductase (luciferase family)
VPLAGRGALFEAALAAMERTWQDAGDRPRIVLAGTVPAAFARAAADVSEGWVAPLFGLDLLRDGGAAVARAWADAGRAGRPRLLTGRYFSLGPDADAVADEYIEHYYGSLALARADTLTDAAQIHAELERLSAAGCDDVLLFPCSGGLEQVALLAAALARSGSRFGELPEAA